MSWHADKNNIILTAYLIELRCEMAAIVSVKPWKQGLHGRKK